jgi:hypothetical protein
MALVKLIAAAAKGEIKQDAKLGGFISVRRLLSPCVKFTTGAGEP